MLDLTQNYFQLFGLPAAFDIDATMLAERYRELQRIVHPDRHASGTDQQRRLSMQGATYLNEALETLRDPLRRARYLLALRGLDPDAGGERPMAPHFLMEQMELRERLAELRGGADPLAEAGAFLADVRRRVAAAVETLAAQFAAGDAASLAAAAEGGRELQFLRKLQHEAEALEAELEDAH
jgi:molecular chaperone HscB